ncbi:DNA-processing protein DprA [Rubellimicrobium roseum]
MYSFHDEGYPHRLRGIGDPPAVLFVKGDPTGLDAPRSLAVVGTREPTEFGSEVARRSGQSAAQAGFAIVSGLAHGCDTFGHEGCLEGNGVGVAVMAHGLDRIYPVSSRDLSVRLLETGGCLVSEYPLGMTPVRAAFAERDRIQSGLSDGVLVIETDEKGGTMHTVRFALEQQRSLACISHPNKWLSFEKTRGNQKLIKEGRARPIPDGEALLSFLAEIPPQIGSLETSADLPRGRGTRQQLTWDL